MGMAGGFGPWNAFPVIENSIIPKEWAEAYKAILLSSGIRSGRVGIDYMTFPIFQELEKNREYTFVHALKEILLARAVKSTEEIKVMKVAASVVDDGMRAALDAIKPGIRENEIYAEAISTMIKQGSEGEPFFQMLSSGPRSVQYTFPTNKKVNDGEPVIIDIGCYVNGYVGDCMRTGCAGHLSQKVKELYSSLYEAYMGGLNKAKPGVKTSQIDKETRRILKEHGYASAPIGYGHGVGLKCVELPWVTTEKESFETDLDVLKPGMIMTFEPRTARETIGMAGLEDMILITESGYEFLTKSPYLEEALN